jgi:hypothetical protein
LARQIGFYGCLVNEDKLIRMRLKVVSEPVSAAFLHMGAQRSRLAATSDFFICVPELAEEPSDGGRVRGNASGSFQCSCKFWQGDIAILRYQFFQKCLMT